MTDPTGTWHLHRWHSLKNGVPDGYPMGEDALGQLLYGQDGEMSAFLMRADFAVSRDGPTTDSFLSYAGSWTVVDDEITHHVRFASAAHWIGRPLVRRMRMEGDALALSTAPETSRSGSVYVHELLWRRHPPI
ncbi:MAG: lipocalin-like domain-containing protein [Nitratireductor sp.]